MTGSNTFIIMHQTITNHDAIGNDIEKMQSLINERYGECFCYADNCFNKKVTYISRDEMLRRIEDPSTVIIYHHSVFWEEGEKILARSKCRIIFRYHNITPEVFFERYGAVHYEQCKKGREQTVRFMKNYSNSRWICASPYNAGDLCDVREGCKLICPPFNKIEDWGNTPPNDEITGRLLENPAVNLLFVSRIAPNKNITGLLDIVHNYIVNYDGKVMLRIIGKKDENLVPYNNEIEGRLKVYGIEKNVEFIGEVNDELLSTYYLASDLFISASKHEGFFVPAIEAQYFGLPVIALDSTAVPDTTGGGALILEKDVRLFSAAIHIIMKKAEYRVFLRKEGIRNFESRFTFSAVSKTFDKCLKECLGD